jgi:hypothetical protein
MNTFPSSEELVKSTVISRETAQRTKSRKRKMLRHGKRSRKSNQYLNPKTQGQSRRANLLLQNQSLGRILQKKVLKNQRRP